MAKFGTSSVEAAQEAFDAADERARLVSRLRERCTAYAPQGLDRLANEVVRLEALAGDPADVVTDTNPQELAEDVDTAEAAVFELQGELRAVEASLADAATELARADERAAGTRAQLAAVIARIGDDAFAAKADRVAAVKTTRAALEAAQQGLLDREANAPSLAAARADVERLEAGARNRSARRQALLERRGALRETMRTAGVDALGEALADARGKLTRATRRHDVLVRRADALVLLVKTLERTGADLRERFLAPVQSRLGPFLREVIPDAQINMGGDFRAVGLSRNGREEAVLSLSGGTQGQVAVLTRLAFADVMQARGRPVPVVLDETFVHSDDQRLEGLFCALNMACAGGVQCVVMTCHDRMYRDLGGHRVIPRMWSTD